MLAITDDIGSSFFFSVLNEIIYCIIFLNKIKRNTNVFQ